jgi:LmbE family N-acetylglucosaminyl deacetylase
MWDRSMLACFAHPDDEQLVSGSLMRAVANGWRTGLLVTTRGEAGEIADPALATPRTLAAVRETELRAAATLIGIPRENLFLLDYRDSGMAGTPENQHPQAAINADEDAVVGQIVRVIRAFQPTLVFTFDAGGAYGHPDHLAIHRWTTLAFAAAGQADRYPEAGPPYQPARLFYAVVPRSLATQVDADFAEVGVEDSTITHRVPVEEFLERKMAALRVHATQWNPIANPWLRKPADLARRIHGTEHYQFGAGLAYPDGADPSDLFAGLEEE